MYNYFCIFGMLENVRTLISCNFWNNIFVFCKIVFLERVYFFEQIFFFVRKRVSARKTKLKMYSLDLQGQDINSIPLEKSKNRGGNIVFGSKSIFLVVSAPNVTQKLCAHSSETTKLQTHISTPQGSLRAHANIVLKPASGRKIFFKFWLFANAILEFLTDIMTTWLASGHSLGKPATYTVWDDFNMTIVC